MIESMLKSNINLSEISFLGACFMQIFLRHAANTDYLPNPFFAKAYDARILYVLSGRGEMRFANETVPLCADVLCYYPAGTLYYPVSSLEDPMTFVTLNFDFTHEYTQYPHAIYAVPESEYCPDRAQMTHLNADLPRFAERFVLRNAWHFRADLLRIADFFQQSTPHAHQIADALLQAVCYELMDYTNEPQNRAYRQAVAYISQHYTEKLTNQQIAQALNYHPNYLNVVFRQCSGTTIHRYCMQLRLQKAALLLHQSELSVSEVAAAVGFENADHFSNRFRQAYHIPPSVYHKKAGFI